MTRESGQKGLDQGLASEVGGVSLRDRGWMDGWVKYDSSVRCLHAQRGIMAEYDEWIWCGVYTLLSMITRYWRIGSANYVVWDEVSLRLFKMLS